MRTLPIFAGGIAAAAAAVAVGLTVAHADPLPLAPASTPIKHLVVIFDENISFDHYFGTYPNATNPAGEPRFTPTDGTPSVNGLDPTLLTNNPNSTPSAATRPLRGGHVLAEPRLRRRAAGLRRRPDGHASSSSPPAARARARAASRSSWTTTTATPSPRCGTRAALRDERQLVRHELRAVDGRRDEPGQRPDARHRPRRPARGVEDNTIIGDPDPKLDDCANPGGVQMSGKNVGDLLNAHSVSWGWFQGGFKPTSVDGTGKAVCGSSHNNVADAPVRDYIPHHEPFQYYASTANIHHLPPTSTAMIGSHRSGQPPVRPERLLTPRWRHATCRRSRS